VKEKKRKRKDEGNIKDKKGQTEGKKLREKQILMRLGMRKNIFL
jgi:hypothetical protein